MEIATRYAQHEEPAKGNSVCKSVVARAKEELLRQVREDGRHVLPSALVITRNILVQIPLLAAVLYTGYQLALGSEHEQSKACSS